ncbi:MAG: hypothetical protein EOP48_16125 [Sphingobacteriales bacterium]|nr:MAG: hypothetical protein EOP48_16125 [Sphingobacteriales bacterium]
MLLRCFSVLISLLILCSDSFGQKNEDEQLLLNSKNRSASKLFVHFDKNVYTNNETAWFTGYMLNGDITTSKDIFVVALIRDIDGAIMSQEKFIIEKGMVYGNFTIPNLLVSGAYRFFTYTNSLKNGKPAIYFEQPITIISTAGLLKIDVKKDGGPSDGRFKLTVKKDNKKVQKPVTITYIGTSAESMEIFKVTKPFWMSAKNGISGLTRCVKLTTLR